MWRIENRHVKKSTFVVDGVAHDVCPYELQSREKEIFFPNFFPKSPLQLALDNHDRADPFTSKYAELYPVVVDIGRVRGGRCIKAPWTMKTVDSRTVVEFIRNVTMKRKTLWGSKECTAHYLIRIWIGSDTSIHKDLDTIYISSALPRSLFHWTSKGGLRDFDSQATMNYGLSLCLHRAADVETLKRFEEFITSPPLIVEKARIEWRLLSCSIPR